MRYLSFVKRNIRRTPYQALTASVVMFLTFFTLLVFLLIALGSQKILQYYESKPQAIAFFKDNTTNQDIQAIQNEIMKTGKVTSLNYVNKEQALQIYKQQNKDNPQLLELVTANILPASLEISTQTPQDLAPIAQVLGREPVIEQVIVPSDVIENLTKATTIIRWVGAGAVGFLMIFAILVTVMVIGFKIRIKRTEIETMKLLGASNNFIRTPFILEGITYGLTGAFAAWIASYTILWYFTPFLQVPLGDINILPVSPLLMIGLLGTVLIVATLIGLIGSFGAVRRYLRI